MARPALAADDIVIGAIYPMSGALANAGNDARHAIETAVEIVNGAHDVPMLMGKGGGLPHHGGAHIRVVFADHQSDPQKARAEAERLITQEHVAVARRHVPECGSGDRVAGRRALRGPVPDRRRLERRASRSAG